MNDGAELDLFTIRVLDIPDVKVEPYEGGSENIAFYRVSGVKVGDVLNIQIQASGNSSNGLVIECSEADRVHKGEAAPLFSFTHTVQDDEEGLSLRVWPKVARPGVAEPTRNVVLIFNTN